MEDHSDSQSEDSLIRRALGLAHFFKLEDVKGAGPAGVRQLDHDPARGRVSINNLDTVSAMLRCNDGRLVEEFGHARIRGRLVYDVESGSIVNFEASVSGLEGQETEHFTIARQVGSFSILM